MKLGQTVYLGRKAATVVRFAGVGASGWKRLDLRIDGEVLEGVPSAMDADHGWTLEPRTQPRRRRK